MWAVIWCKRTKVSLPSGPDDFSPLQRFSSIVHFSKVFLETLNSTTRSSASHTGSRILSSILLSVHKSSFSLMKDHRPPTPTKTSYHLGTFPHPSLMQYQTKQPKVPSVWIWLSDSISYVSWSLVSDLSRTCANVRRVRGHPPRRRSKWKMKQTT